MRAFLYHIAVIMCVAALPSFAVSGALPPSQQKAQAAKQKAVDEATQENADAKDATSGNAQEAK